MVNQVTVVAILMIVQGGLECLLGLIYAALGPVLSTFFNQMGKVAPPGQGPPPEMDTMMKIMSAVYVVLGVLLLAAGVLKIFAGIKNLKFRGRTLGIVAMACGAVAWPTIYCAPTSIGLLVYGLIVYLNEDVRRAFQMGERGASPEEIKAPFGVKRRPRRHEEQDSEGDWD